MSIVRRTSKQIRDASKKEHAHTDWAKLRATTESDIKQHARADKSETEKLGDPYYIRKAGIEKQEIQRIRKKFGPTRAAFAKRFGLSERTIAEWELGRQAPTGPALVLLRVIEHEPAAVERALRTSSV